MATKYVKITVVLYGTDKVDGLMTSGTHTSAANVSYVVLHKSFLCFIGVNNEQIELKCYSLIILGSTIVKQDIESKVVL